MEALDELLNKLNNIPVPTNPLDITDEQLKKMSNIIGMTMMIQMARNNIRPPPPPPPTQTYPPTYDMSISELRLRVEALERAADEVSKVLVRLENEKMNRQ